MRFMTMLTGLVLVVAGGSVGSAPDPVAAPANPYKGMQERDAVFEFTQQPKVEKQGEKWVVTFASKAKCDATVAILDKDGKIIRHLASGVLGKNAPAPFQQNSLSQKIEWDGTDDAGRKAPGECRARVSLGLKPRFERNIGWDPYFMAAGSGGCQLPEFSGNTKQFVVGRDNQGALYVLGTPNYGGYVGRVFAKDGKYLRTFWPPPAKDVEKLKTFGYRFAKTVWGDQVLVSEDRNGPLLYKGDGRRDGRSVPLPDHGKVMFGAADVAGYKMEDKPAQLPTPKLDWNAEGFCTGHFLRMAANRTGEEVYVGYLHNPGLIRIDGRTGKVDKTWYPEGGLTKVSEVCIGPEGHVYISSGSSGYGQFITRLDRTGKPVPFAGDSVPLPRGTRWEGGGGQYGPMEGKDIYGGQVCPPALGKYQGEIRSLWTGHFGHSNVHERGMYVSPKGCILHAVQRPSVVRAFKYGVPKDAPQDKERVFESYVAVWDNDGKLLTANAVGDMQNGHGVAMDADGNVYAALGGRVPAGQKTYEGIVDEALSASTWGSYGSLLKFHGGASFPLGKAHYGKSVPAGAAKVEGGRGRVTAVEGAQWMYGGLVCQTADECTCHNVRYDMDYFARHWLPANQLYSVIVLDANGNRIARLGRYGNVDDTEEDVKAGRDGLRFCWPRALCVSDGALYVADAANRRILKAAISYHAEHVVPIP